MTEQNPRGADLEEFERVDDVTPALPDGRSGSDKDFLRGNGEDGPSTRPVTDDDLLNDGAGWPHPDLQDQDVKGPGSGRVLSA